MVRFQLGFKFGDALAQRQDSLFHFFGCVARGDVLLAVPIVRNDIDEKHPFNNALHIRGGGTSSPTRGVDERPQRAHGREF